MSIKGLGLSHIFQVSSVVRHPVEGPGMQGSPRCRTLGQVQGTGLPTPPPLAPGLQAPQVQAPQVQALARGGQAGRQGRRVLWEGRARGGVRWWVGQPRSLLPHQGGQVAMVGGRLL